MGFSAVSDSGVSPFNGMQFDYFGSIDANVVSKCGLLNSPHNSITEFII